MDSTAISPQNFEERVVWYSITWTYGFYALGALYIVAPVIAWILFLYLCRRLIEQYFLGKVTMRVPFSIWLWIIGMLVMQVALVAGHFDFELGMAKTIKSSVGWAKGWALIALFPLIGAALEIRPELIYRATCVVCKHTLMLIPLFIMAYVIRLPDTVYVSPLKAVGGPGPEFFSLTLYGIDPGSGEPRWRFFTPWAPAIGFVANVYLLFALQEKSRKWMIYGILGCVMMCLMSKSRLALISMTFIPIAVWGLSRLLQPYIHFIGAFGVTFLGLLAPQIIELINTLVDRFTSARAASSRVRKVLGEIAVQRWRTEAPIWGHGIVEKGPHLVEYMPIGSHHSWYGLLYVKGIVGFIALAVPMAWSFIELLFKSQYDANARVGLGVILILFLYTFGENLEILAYLYWPGLVLLGIAHKAPWRNPLAPPASEEKIYV